MHLHIDVHPIILRMLWICSHYPNTYADEYFRGYPGPVLNSWDDLPSFMYTLHSPSKLKELDSLQQAIVDWYEKFKNKVRKDLALHLDQIMRYRIR